MSLAFITAVQRLPPVPKRCCATIKVRQFQNYSLIYLNKLARFRIFGYQSLVLFRDIGG
jgi:hypothetical protein